MIPLKDKQVYCLNCRHVDTLFEAIRQGNADNPSPCNQCFPYDVEDSRSHSERPYYTDDQTSPLKSLG